MSTGSGNRDQGTKLLRKSQQSSSNSIDLSRRPNPRSYASAAAADEVVRRLGETQAATKQVKESDGGKPEQRSEKPLPENPLSSSPSEVEQQHHEHERTVDRQPSTTESGSKKVPSSTGDPTQPVRRGSTRSSSVQLPAGAGMPNRFDGETKTLTATTDTTTSHSGPKTSSVKSDDVPATTPSVTDPQPELEEGVNDTGSGKRVLGPDISKKEQTQNTSTTVSDSVRPKGPPEADQGEDSQAHSDSETASNNAVAQDGAGYTSGMLGGIANALGMRPPTAKEARLEKDNHRLKEENKYLRTEFFTVQSAARKYHHDAFRFHHEKERLQETLEAMSLEVKGVTKRYEEAKSLSDTRGKELIGAQVFLTKADGLSISELIQKVDGLNDEIYQAAASLGESIVQKNVNPSEQTPYSSDEGATAKALLGSPLCKVLRSRARKPEEGINPLLVQITLQTFFSVFCDQRIQSWNPSNPAFDGILQELYQKIWSSSDQAVSGRWRSLTRAQLKPETNGWIKELMTDLDAILALASWEIGSPEDRHTLEARLPAIFKVVLDVREAIGEKFTSADIEVTYVEANTPFSDIYMEEAYAADSEGHRKDPEMVIATVGMGVRKVVMMKEGRGYEYVLSPKVVLESSLRAVLEPPPPRPSRAKSTKRS